MLKIMVDPETDPETDTATAADGLAAHAAHAAHSVHAVHTAHAVRAITDSTFAEEVLAATPRPVLVDFTADWCPPCRMIAPVLDQLAAELGERLKVVSLNVDANPEAQAAYNVLTLPTLMLFRGGVPVKVLIGARPKRRLLQELADEL